MEQKGLNTESDESAGSSIERLAKRRTPGESASTCANSVKEKVTAKKDAGKEKGQTHPPTSSRVRKKAGRKIRKEREPNPRKLELR